MRNFSGENATEAVLARLEGADNPRLKETMTSVIKHIHVIVGAEGYERLTTQLFVDGDPYLDSDAVFGIKDSLVAEFVGHDDGEDGKPYHAMEHDFGLSPGGP